MRLLLTSLACLLFNTSTMSQTIVRGNSRIIYESEKVKLIEEHRKSNDYYISWNWEYESYIHGSPFASTVAGWSTKAVGFRMENLEESINLMQECIKILEMEEGLGSHDKIVHEYGGVDMIRAGSNPNVVELHPWWGGDPIKGRAYHNSELSLTEQECYFLIQKLKNHRTLLGK